MQASWQRQGGVDITKLLKLDENVRKHSAVSVVEHINAIRSVMSVQPFSHFRFFFLGKYGVREASS